MVRIVWTPQSADDLENIKEYIAHDSLQRAEIIVRSIIKKILLLRDFPLIGRIVPDINDPIVRETFRLPYRIVYRHIESEQVIEIITIRHSSRLPNISTDE